MRKFNIDIAATLEVTVPDTLAQEYRKLAILKGDLALARVSKELPDDADFTDRILLDNVRYVVAQALPQYLEAAGFGVRVVPLALRESHVSDVEYKEVEQLDLPLEQAENDDDFYKVGGTD